MFAAKRCASSSPSNFAAERRPGRLNQLNWPLASRRQPIPQTCLGLPRASSGFGAPFLFFVTVQPFGQAAGDVAWFRVRLYVTPQSSLAISAPESMLC